MSMRKGQAAMEYLMTYGWAILIVIVVVAALYAMGVFRIGAPPVACSPCFSKFAFVGYTKTGDVAGGNVEGRMKIKTGAEEISITGITEDSVGAGAIALSGYTLPTGTISPGTELEVLNVTNTTSSTVITINYDVTATGYSYSDTATIHN